MVFIPAGSKCSVMIDDPTMEANQNAFNAEGMEKVVANHCGTSNATAVTDTVNNAGGATAGLVALFHDGTRIT